MAAQDSRSSATAFSSDYVTNRHHRKCDRAVSGTHKVGGYSILQGESLEEISKLLDGHPHFHSPNASVEVREFLSMPGMS